MERSTEAQETDAKGTSRARRQMKWNTVRGLAPVPGRSSVRDGCSGPPSAACIPALPTQTYFCPPEASSPAWPHHTAGGILVPRPGIEPVPPTVEAWSPNHWTTREVPCQPVFKARFISTEPSLVLPQEPKKQALGNPTHPATPLPVASWDHLPGWSLMSRASQTQLILGQWGPAGPELGLFQTCRPFINVTNICGAPTGCQCWGHSSEQGKAPAESSHSVRGRQAPNCTNMSVGPYVTVTRAGEKSKAQ